MQRVTRILAFAIVAIALAVTLFGRAYGTQFQRAQIGVGIVIDVTPAPLAYTIRRVAPQSAPRRSPIQVTYAARLPRAGEKRRVPSFRLSDGTIQIAQATAQKSIAVKANVSPNPNATLLYPNTSVVEFGAIAGRKTTVPCAFTITISTNVINWTLQTALSADFIDQFTFPGNDLSFAMFSSPGPSPRPSPEATTAYVVYPDNNNNPIVAVASGRSQVYCVDLTINVPAAIPSGQYLTTAVYTLQY